MENYKFIDLKKANDGKHKYIVKFRNIKTNREKSVKFGAVGFEDMSIHKDPERKKRYIQRHSGMNEDWTDWTTAGFWSRWLLWNLPTLKDSFLDIKKRFPDMFE